MYLNSENIIIETREVKYKEVKASRSIDSRELAYKAARLAHDKKATDIEVLDLRNCADFTDFVVIASGQASPQLKAIARHIEENLSLESIEPGHIEGKYGDKWFVLDYIDFVVHIIDHEARDFYNLEELWSKAFFIPEDEWH